MPSRMAQYLAEATRQPEPRPTRSEDKGAEIRGLYKEGLRQLRGNRGLHPETRRVEAARLYATTRAALRKVQAEQVQADQAAWPKLERRLWGYDDVRATATDRATVDATIRDAQDRAAQLKKPGDAARALAMAEQAGDQVLARAIGQRANEQDWDDVVQDYLATRSTARDVYAEMCDIYQRQRTPGGVLGQQHLVALGKPEELRDLTDKDIEQMSADPADTAA